VLSVFPVPLAQFDIPTAGFKGRFDDQVSSAVA
jgi:hypothetical protein